MSVGCSSKVKRGESCEKDTDFGVMEQTILREGRSSFDEHSTSIFSFDGDPLVAMARDYDQAKWCVGRAKHAFMSERCFAFPAMGEGSHEAR